MKNRWQVFTQTGGREKQALGALSLPAFALIYWIHSSEPVQIQCLDIM